MGFTEVRVMAKGTEISHGGNMGNSIDDVRENVDKIFYKGAMDEALKQKISEEGSPDYMYTLQTEWKPKNE